MKRFYRTIILSICSFVITNNCMAFDTWWHAECTRKAMVANGFSADARLATQFSNYLTDFFPVYNIANEKLHGLGLERLKVNGDLSYDFMHFDAVFTQADIERNWKL